VDLAGGAGRPASGAGDRDQREGRLHRIDSSYDAKTGMLSATTPTQQIGLAQIIHRLQLTGQQ
jgi:hypothetical protein